MVTNLRFVDIFPVRGFHDLLIVHCDALKESLEYQLKPAAGLYQEEDTVWFECDNYIKFGQQLVTVPDWQLVAPPDSGRLEAIVRLAGDWNAADQTERASLIGNQLIMPEPHQVQDLRSHCLRRSLLFTRLMNDLPSARRNFQDGVLAQFHNDHRVVSIIIGHSPVGTPFTYMLDILANPYETDDIIWRIHHRSLEINLPAPTRTIDLELADKTDLWTSLRTPTVSPHAVRLLSDLLKKRWMPYDELLTHLGYASGVISQLHATFGRLGYAEGLKGRIREIEQAVLWRDANEYRGPVMSLIDELKTQILEVHPDLAKEAGGSHKTSALFRAFFQKFKQDRQAARLEAHILEMTEYRNWFAHPYDHAAQLAQLDLKKIDRLWSDVLLMFGLTALRATAND
ncbi:hypothetical protein HY634_04330 [Candidatus Uhrbacteria bacterium]|nr:hypothetical protein [Candidatus Uhrbacteria bacterium]